MNLKEIATTLAVLGSGALALSGCDKEKPATEVPGDAAVPTDAAGEGSCASDDHPGEGHCGDDKGEAAGEGSCGGDKAEGSCGAEKGEGSCGGEKAESGEEG